MSLFGELQRRNVFRVAAAYIVAAWLIIQVAETCDGVGAASAAINNNVIPDLIRDLIRG